MRVTISGAGGFIGGHLVKDFAARPGCNKINALFHKAAGETASDAIKRQIQKTELLERIPVELHEKLNFIDCDITNPYDMEELFKELEAKTEKKTETKTEQPITKKPNNVFIHAAAKLISPKSDDSDACKKFLEINEAQVLANAIANYQLANELHCVFLSSVYVFNTTGPDPIDETTVLACPPPTLYVKSKQAAEKYWVSRVKDIDFLYVPQVCGSHQHTEAILPVIANLLLFGGDTRDLKGGINPIHINNLTKIIYCVASFRADHHALEPRRFCIAGDGDEPLDFQTLAIALQNAAKKYNPNPFPAFKIIEGIKNTIRIDDKKLREFYLAGNLGDNMHTPIPYETTAQELMESVWRRGNAIKIANANLSGVTRSLRLSQTPTEIQSAMPLLLTRSRSPSLKL